MIRAVWHRLRRIRAHTLFLLLIISLVIYCLQLPDSLAEHPEHSTGHHRSLLVTTPSNQSYPLHYISLDSVHGRLESNPVAASLGDRQSVSHLVGHPRRDNLFYVNNEITPGSIITGTVRGTRNESNIKLDVQSSTMSQGDLPAHSLVTRDGQHLISINYGSSAVAMYSIEAGGKLQLRQTLDLPRPVWHDNTVVPHPHHVAQHPRDSRTFYIPDLGYNVIYVLRKTRNKDKTFLSVVQTFDTRTYGGGPRNGVVSHDGKAYFLSFQISSTVMAIPLDRHNLLQHTNIHPIYTLPAEIIDSDLPTVNGRIIHMSSDILLLNDQLLVANRRTIGPYSAMTHRDTIAIFNLRKSRLNPAGHIRTGCWQPRELFLVKRDRRDLLAVTCNGNGKEGAGVVLFDPSDGYREVGKWDTEMSVFGIVGSSMDI